LDQYLSPNNFRTAIGVPAEWQMGDSARLDLLRQVVTTAGFPAVELVWEPVAALLYHAFRGEVTFARHSQRWLVVDFGQTKIDLTIVETGSGGSSPELIRVMTVPYGGQRFDTLLVNQFLLAHFWKGLTPEASEQLELEQFARQFKEKFSDRLRQGADSYGTYCRISGIARRVNLTRTEFESSAMAAPLIDEFARVISDELEQANLSFDAIEGVIVTGGSARWYFVRSIIDKLFGRPVAILADAPELSVAKGLAVAFIDFERVITEPSTVTLSIELEPEPLPVQVDSPAATIPAPVISMVSAASSPVPLSIHPALPSSTYETLAFWLELGGGLVGILGFGWLFVLGSPWGCVAGIIWWGILGLAFLVTSGLVVATGDWWPFLLMFPIWLSGPLGSGLLAYRRASNRKRRRELSN
jgi:hypothetical protein